MASKRTLIIPTLIIAAMSLAGCAPKDKYISFSGFAQGGTYTVKLNLNGSYGRIKERPEDIQTAVDSILRDIDNSLSGYNKNSIISRFNKGEEVTPDKIFSDIYTKAVEFHDETSGRIDVASGALFDIWGFGFRNGEMPDDATVEKTRRASGMGRLKRSISEAMREDGTVNGRRLLLSDEMACEGIPTLNYNAIAQGYSSDLVAEYLYSIGVKDMMVDIGEIFCDGVNPSGKPWTIGIDKPVDGNQELGAQIQGIFRSPAGPHGIVTSGNYRKFIIKDGRKYAHTIDPLTGYPVEHTLLSATIVAPDATMADAYATYCMVIGLEAAKVFLESRPDLEGCLIYDEDGSFRTWCSEGFVLEIPEQ